MVSFPTPSCAFEESIKILDLSYLTGLAHGRWLEVVHPAITHVADVPWVL